MAAEEKTQGTDNAGTKSNQKAQKMLIALGSGSYIKKKVVEDTFGVKNVEVLTFKFASGVPEQPVGKAETQKGAQFRADKAMQLKPDASLWIGIENGMYREPPAEAKDDADVFDHWYDVGCIVIMYKDNDGKLATDVCWSDSLKIPVESCKECLEKDGKSAKNDGNYTWSPLKDPHEQLTNGKKPRKIWLLEALQKWKENSMFK